MISSLNFVFIYIDNFVKKHYQTFPRFARGLYHFVILTKMTNLKEKLMCVYKIVHEGDFNKNDNFDCTKLCTHGYKFLNATLTEMNTSENRLFI